MLRLERTFKILGNELLGKVIAYFYRQGLASNYQSLCIVFLLFKMLQRITYFTTFAGKSAKMETSRRFVTHLTLLVHLQQRNTTIILRFELSERNQKQQNTKILISGRR